MKSYKVVHIPYNRNPYQELLLDQLKMLGVSTRYGDIKKLVRLGDVTVLYNTFYKGGLDILHLHWQHAFLRGRNKLKMILRSMSFICQLLFIRVLGKKVVWTVHNLQNHEGRHEKLEIFFSRIVARCVNCIIAHCESARSMICDAYNINDRKITTIPHGSYLGVYENSVSREDARKLLNLSRTNFVFLFFGNLRRYKGLAELVEAFRRLDGKSTVLLIAGKPEDKSLVALLEKKTSSSSNIKLMPRFIADDEIQVLMNASDVMVLPYVDILTSGAALLGLSFGKAMIAPRIGCFPEILNSSNGFLYDQNEKEGLLNAMRQAMKFALEIAEMENRNLNLARSFDWRDIAVRTYELYERCIEG